MKGVKITEELLLELGCEMDREYYVLTSRGYQFIFNKDQTGGWELSVCNTESIRHSVSHLDEVFGCIAEDMFDGGVKSNRQDIRNALGIM